jgi:cytochrome P450
MTKPFIPPHPPRSPGPVASWRGFFGERARTAVYGWSEQAFRLPYMRRKILGFRVHIPLEPDDVQHVLLDNAANYAKPDVVKALLAPAIGQGLLTSDGSLWREQRRIVAANFAPAAVDALVPEFGAVGREALGRWQPGARNMAVEATQATMRVISNTLFGGDARLTSDAAMAHIAAALEGVSEARLQAMLGLPRIPWSRKGLVAQRGQAYLRRTLEDVVRERLPEGGPDDFLGRLIRGLNERFEPKQAAALAADNAMTFYLAGHDRQCGELGAFPPGRAAGAPGAAGRGGGIRAGGRGGGRSSGPAAEAAPGSGGDAPPLPVGAALRPPGGGVGPPLRRGGPTRRHRLDLAVAAAPAQGAVGRSGRVRCRALR